MTTRVNLSLPDDVAEELTLLAETLGVSRSAFLSAYLARRIRRLRMVAEEFAVLDPPDPSGAVRRYRGDSVGRVLRMAEWIADAVDDTDADDPDAERPVDG